MHIRLPSSTPMAKQSKLGSTFAALILIKVNTCTSCTKSALSSLNKSVEAGSHKYLFSLHGILFIILHGRVKIKQRKLTLVGETQTGRRES